MLRHVARTNIDIDEALVERAMRLYGVRTKREAVDLALRHLVGGAESGDMRELRGTGWLGDLADLRSPRGAG
jgi:Arc/MetJ family transcription regulator